MRLEGKTAVIIGAGQSPGDGIGNGRATAIRFGQEGAKVLAVDRNIESARETAKLVTREGAECLTFEADVTHDASLAEAIQFAHDTWGRIDILDNNVGVSVGGGDQPLSQITEETFDRITAINLRGTIMTCKHVVPIMCKQHSGVIINISSMAAWVDFPLVAYKTTKAGMIAFTQQLALDNAPYGVRANVILPGLMNTPMAVDTRVRATGKTREEIVAQRDAQVPLRGKMGSAWDVANAALFLASDEAQFITGIALPVDGGALARRG
ncbi:MAG: SDR family oxidoreductase [Burkholderiales bacterium]|nr:SDR family oxidoreductase [Burkholderiales bacterium]